MTDAKRKDQTTTPSSSGRFAYEGLDRVMHEKARLGLMTCLAGAPEGLTFNELKRLCDLTDGNLNRHLKQLADANLIRLVRDEAARRPQTTCLLTDAGRESFAAYLAELQRVLGDAQRQINALHPNNSQGKSATRLASDSP
ncbi:transcriptional regulator [Rhodopirellula maiorica SM1]|uniref:Transcriptional regulator n=1 Tax=Rhodopirellula maiorica SM1 TaxID=1265738 RepID=M5RWR5_9BACT|nr:transcriptional regulator [Rhodopirellula maiorica]EMI18389.1 transcriptional regulator [Rhodopirellula maiorica SM1]